MKSISSNVYVETGYRGSNNSFIVTSDGVVMIDTPYNPTDAIKWRDVITSYGNIRYIINTSPHVDHNLSNYIFPGQVIASTGTRDVLLTLDINKIRANIQRFIQPRGFPLPDKLEIKLPDITFTQQLDLYVGNHTFQLIPLPGHTLNEIGVYVPEEKVIFTGDLVQCKVQTFLREPYPDKWLESLQRIDELEVDVIVPGHGQVCDKSYIKEQAHFMQEWMDSVQEAIRRGLSKEEAQNEISFADRYPMEPGHETLLHEMQKWNVAGLYDYYTLKAQS